MSCSAAETRQVRKGLTPKYIAGICQKPFIGADQSGSAGPPLLSFLPSLPLGVEKKKTFETQKNEK